MLKAYQQPLLSDVAVSRHKEQKAGKTASHNSQADGSLSDTNLSHRRLQGLERRNLSVIDVRCVEMRTSALVPGNHRL